MPTQIKIIKILIIEIVFSIYCLGNSTLYAEDFFSHSIDWNRLVGLNKCLGKNDPMEICWKKYSHIIDKKSFEMQSFMVHTEPYKLNHGECKHRTYYHWGFHANPKMIRNTLENCITNWETKDEIIKNEIIELLKNKQIQNNINMINAITSSELKSIGISECRSLAPILYDVHILTDYKTNVTKPLANLDYLRSEINSDILRLFRGTNVDIRNIRSKLMYAARSSSNKKECANNMLRILHSDFPKLFWKAFENKVSEKIKACRYDNEVSHK